MSMTVRRRIQHAARLCETGSQPFRAERIRRLLREIVNDDNYDLSSPADDGQPVVDRPDEQLAKGYGDLIGHLVQAALHGQLESAEVLSRIKELFDQFDRTRNDPRVGAAAEGRGARKRGLRENYVPRDRKAVLKWLRE